MKKRGNGGRSGKSKSEKFEVRSICGVLRTITFSWRNILSVKVLSVIACGQLFEVKYSPLRILLDATYCISKNTG